MKVYQTINITLHSTVSSRTYNQGVATEWIQLLQKDVPGLMQKPKKKTDNVTQNAQPATFKRISHFGDRAHFSPQSGFNPRGDRRPLAFLRPIFLVVPSCCWMHFCTPGDSPGRSGVKLIMYGVVGFLRCVWCVKLWDLGGTTAATRVVTGGE